MAAPSSIRIVHARAGGTEPAPYGFTIARARVRVQRPELQLRDEQQVFECPPLWRGTCTHPALSYMDAKALAKIPARRPGSLDAGAREATLRGPSGRRARTAAAPAVHAGSTLAGGVMQTSRRLSCWGFFRVDARR